MKQILSRRSIVSVGSLGSIALVLVPVQQILVFVFWGLIQPELPVSNADSVYALGRLGWLWRVGAAATGVGFVALGLGLRRSLDPGKGVRLATMTLVIGGLCVVATGIFQTDPPDADGGSAAASGVLHVVFGLLGLLTLLVVVFALRGVFARDRRWAFAARPTSWLAWWLLGAVVALFVIPENSTAAGIVQRLVFIPDAVWGVWLAWNLRSLGVSDARSPRPLPEPL